MEIKVSSTNEFRFVPDIMDNLKLPEKEQFVIVVKKVSNTLHSTDWISLDEEGQGKIDNSKRLLLTIVRFEKPPIMDAKGGKTNLTPEELTSGKYDVLYGILDDLALFISDLQKQEAFETKKS